MTLRFLLLSLLLASATVPIRVSAQQLPAYLRVRASDVLDASEDQALERASNRQHVRAAQMMAWGAGLTASLIPYAGIVHAMEQSCYDGPKRIGSQFIMYGVLGSVGITLLATGIARWRRLPEAYTAAHPLPEKQRQRAQGMSILAMLSGLTVTSLATIPEWGVCGSS